MLQWGHIDDAVEDGAGFVSTPSGTEKCFNGATAMTLWKTKMAIDWLALNVKLQWGHSDDAVEDLVASTAHGPRG